ncbi:sugar nucleotide-binding protein [Citricoccus sp.]|uniref:sugar nucleotide-binding protein n=1 Tax=Citricoccus sp. TaxID=1978372 RepID=UPI002CCFD5A7|nr:sugar nucleotide-binding protein [Citricoccus sp.]HRO92374.1 sugar nucleotide-binding protein [Citricoccus sp.]
MPDALTAPHGPPGRILLVGCGKLGTRLGQDLTAVGWDVFALRRDTASLPAGFSALAVDLREPIRDALPDVDALVITLPPGTQDPGGQPDGYRASLHHLAAALPSVPRRVVFVSSTRVFEGYTDGRVLTEAEAPAPVTARGRALLDGELLASDLFGAHIVRPAGIYGPGRTMLVRNVIEGAPVQYARRTNRIHETDLVRTLEALLVAADPPRLLHAVDQGPVPLGEVVTYIARQLGLPAPPRARPEVASGTILSGARLLGLLGALSYPTFETGYAHLIATRPDGAVSRPQDGFDR